MKRSPLRRKTALRRGKPLSKVSRKRRKEAYIYGVRRKAFLRAHPNCEACLPFGFGRIQLPAVEIHHKHGRAGKNYLDVRTWAAVCRLCHEAIHGAPILARKLGLLA